MNKFKKILLGVASVLTLGALFAVTSVVKAETIVVEPGSTTTSSGNTYVLKAKTIFDNEGKTAPNNGANVSAANLTAEKLNYGIFTFNSGKSWGFRREDTSYSSYDDYGIFSNGSGRTITISLSAGQKIDLSAVVFSTSNTSSNVSTTTNNSSWINSNDSDFAANYTSLKTITDSYTAASAGNYVITFNNKLGFTQLSATISTAAAYTLTYENNGHGTSQSVASDFVAVPTLPTLSEDGWRFDGWYYDNNTWAEPVTAGDSLSADTTIYAKWTDLSATWSVTFKKYSTDAKDYAVVAAPKGESVGSENWPTSPRVLNKTFVGWFDGDTEYTSSSNITADTTLVAKFDELKNDLVVFGDYTTGLSDTASTAEHNFIDGVDATGSTNKKTGSKSYTIGDVAFNGTANSSTFVQCGEITFTLDKQAIVTFYATQTGNKSTNNATTYVINTATNATVMNPVKFDLKDSDSSTLITAFSILLPAGTYKTVQSGLQNWYGIRVNQDVSFDTRTASVFAEKNTTGDTLRFIGGITGVTDLTKISSIELVLKKNGVATKKQIFLTTCYTSVTGASVDCSAHDNLYYVIYRITGVTGLTGTISKQLVVTFTDGQTVVSDVTEISL